MRFFKDNAFLSTKNQDKQLKMVVNAIAKNRYLIFPYNAVYKQYQQTEHFDTTLLSC